LLQRGPAGGKVVADFGAVGAGPRAGGVGAKECDPVHELVRTNNAVLITAIEALLKGAEIPHVVLDRHMSVLEGSLGILPQRILVSEEHREVARQLLEEAGLAHELRPSELRPSELRSGSAVPQDGLTDDAILGGRLRIRQKRRGHRVGHDAILLAAATGARPGDRAIELGAGVGGAGLALAARVADVEVTLIEVDPELAAIAADNIAANSFAGRVRAVALDVLASADDFAARGVALGTADHVLMNPPFNNSSRQNVSPDPGRRSAHVGSDDTLAAWVEAAARLLHSAGTLTLIWRADGLADVLAVLGEGFGDIAVLPVHGRAGQPAIRVLVRGRKGSRAPLALLPGLLLNDADGKPTREAEAVMRGGEALPLIAG
jgi:tRNA1(Val) A37 N6-methylase TrmN6